MFLSFLHVFNAENMKRVTGNKLQPYRVDERELCFARIQRQTCGVDVVAYEMKET